MLETVSSVGATRTTRLPERVVKIRQAVVDDYDNIRALQLRNNLTISDREDWVSLWHGNPAYRHGQWPIGWVLETSKGEIVGSFSNIPSMYRLQGQDLRVASGAGWAVDPQYRAHSIWLLQQFMKQDKVDLLLSTTTGVEAEPVLLLFKWSKIPVEDWRRAGFWVTDYRGFVSAVLRKKSIRLPAAPMHVLASTCFCVDALRGVYPGRRYSAFEVHSCAEFDERFDDFWRELESRNRQVLLAVRTREVLAWHFRNALLQKKLWILAASHKSRLIGYAIFDRHDNPALELKRMRLVDFCALDSSEDILRASLSWMLAKCRQEGIHILEAAECLLAQRDATGVPAPYYRTASSCGYHYMALNKELRDSLRDAAVWRPSFFDGDASL